MSASSFRVLSGIPGMGNDRYGLPAGHGSVTFSARDEFSSWGSAFRKSKISEKEAKKRG